MAEIETETSALDDARAAMAELAGGTDGESANDTVGGLRSEHGDRPEGRIPGNADERESRARDESGRFAKADGERATITEKDLAEKPPAVAKEPAQPAAPSVEKPADDKIAPPVEWKGAGKVKWGLLPKEVQAELRDTYAGLQAQQSEIGPIKEIIDYARPMLVREAGSVGEGIRQLIYLHEASLTKPWEVINLIAQRRGIDLRAAFSGQPQPGTTQEGQLGTQTSPDPALQQRLERLEAQIEQRDTSSTQQTIEAFRADPAHPYFEDVRPTMAALLSSGQAKDLQDAYDKATWADPTIRSSLMQRQTEEAAANRKAEADRARKAAAASLTGSPLANGTSLAAGNPTASVLDDVRAAAREMSGA